MHERGSPVVMRGWYIILCMILIINPSFRCSLRSSRDGSWYSWSRSW